MIITELTDFHAREMDLFARLNEPQLLHYDEPGPGLFLAESPMIVERALDAGYEPVCLLVDRKKLKGEFQALVLRCGDVPVYAAEASLLSGITGFPLTRGILCAMRRRPLPAVTEVCRGASRIAVLEDTVNPTNVGAIFRSAAALGMDAVLLTPACSDPLYRRAIRVSMGTVFRIPWTYAAEPLFPDTASLLAALRKQGVFTAAMALTDRSVPLSDPSLSEKERLALVLGTEGEGLREETIGACDAVVRIPMARGVDSLNVAAASAVAFWQLAGADGIKEE